jgi:DNA repair protein RecO (recombination protein O)
MIEKFEGIVLRTLKYSDGLMIADIYTAQRGRMSFLVPVSHSKRSKVRSVLFQPLSMLTFTATVKAGRNLSRIGEVQPFSMYSSITNDVVKSSIALYLAELLTFALREDGSDDSLFTFLDRSFTLFDNLEHGYADFHLVFMVQLLRFLGIYPNLEDYTPGCYFDLAHGCTTREHPLHPHFLLPENAAIFVDLLHTGYDSMHLLSLNRKLRGEFLATLSLYYQLHIPEFPELKSAAVLRELFD